MIRKTSLTLLVLLTMLGTNRISYASCSSGTCSLITGTTEGIPAQNQFVLDLSYRFIPMDRPHRGNRAVSEALVPEINFDDGEIEENGHTEVRTNNELLQLDIGYGVTKRFGIALNIPFMNNRPHEHYHNHHGGTPSFNKVDGTSGFGDLRISGKYALISEDSQSLFLGIGLKLPTGEYKLNNHSGVINEPTIMPGSGSWDPFFSAYYSHNIMSDFDTFISGSYEIKTENDLDYKMGNILLLNSGINFHLLENRFIASLQINAKLTPHDEFKGMNVSSTGGELVFITPGIRMAASKNFSLYSFVQVPIYQYVNDTNLVQRYGLVIGGSYIF